jgi:hypothetical protein
MASALLAATFAGINGHFALEALLSRAADDFRKKHFAVSCAIGTSSSNKHDNSRSANNENSSSVNN